MEVLKDTRTRARLPKVSSGAEVTFDEEKLHIHKTPEDENSTALQSYGRRIAKMDWLFLGVRQDILRRGRYYLRDYVDGVTGVRALSKLISTTLFLYFAILLPLLGKIIVLQSFAGYFRHTRSKCVKIFDQSTSCTLPITD